MDNLTSLPTLSLFDLNSDLLNTLFPNMELHYLDVYRILAYLDQTEVNPQIFPRVIRAIDNIIVGTGDGDVIIHVRNQTLTVEARERSGRISTKVIYTKINNLVDNEKLSDIT